MFDMFQKLFFSQNFVLTESIVEFAQFRTCDAFWEYKYRFTLNCKKEIGKS